MSGKSADWWDGWVVGVLSGTIVLAVVLIVVLGLLRVGAP